MLGVIVCHQGAISAAKHQCSWAQVSPWFEYVSPNCQSALRIVCTKGAISAAKH
jgi:hypothetical protein